MKQLIVICGPTAVGKTKLSIEIAQNFDAEIFSADSRQVYKELNIGTAKPSHQELEIVKHHFINHVSINENYNVGIYEQQAIATLDKYFETRDIGVLCGGTGLYIDAILNGIDEFPSVEIETEKFYQHKFENEGLDALRQELALKDPVFFAEVDQSNHVRMIRALSVIASSGLPFSSFRIKKTVKRNFNTINILLELPREILYKRIDYRVDQMLKQGLLDEVKYLAAHKDLKALQTVGYQEYFDYLDGKSTFQHATDMVKQNSRRYAKRQITWWRNHGSWSSFAPGPVSEILQHIEIEQHKINI